MTGFQISISEKMYEKIITIHCDQAVKFIRYNFEMVLCYYIRKQSLRGALEKRCFEICIHSTWQMRVDGFVFIEVAGY